jgi:hypothetical protein
MDQTGALPDAPGGLLQRGMIIAPASPGSFRLPLACSANSGQPPVEHSRVSGDKGSGQEDDPDRAEQGGDAQHPGQPVLAAPHGQAVHPRDQQHHRVQGELLAQGPAVPGLGEVG